MPEDGGEVFLLNSSTHLCASQHGGGQNFQFPTGFLVLGMVFPVEDFFYRVRKLSS